MQCSHWVRRSICLPTHKSQSLCDHPCSLAGLTVLLILWYSIIMPSLPSFPPAEPAIFPYGETTRGQIPSWLLQAHAGQPDDDQDELDRLDFENRLNDLVTSDPDLSEEVHLIMHCGRYRSFGKLERPSSTCRDPSTAWCRTTTSECLKHQRHQRDAGRTKRWRDQQQTDPTRLAQHRVLVPLRSSRFFRFQIGH